jgi:hypothetical protein
MAALPKKSTLASKLAMWAVLCFALAAAIYALIWLYSTNQQAYPDGGGLGYYGILLLGGNPLTQWLTWLGLVFTAGAVAAHVATEAVDRAAAHHAPSAGPSDPAPGPDADVIGS